MKTKLLLLGAIVFTTANSFGQLILHETFNYVDGAQNSANELIGKVYAPGQVWIAGPSISTGSTTNDDIVDSPFIATNFGIPAQTANAYFFRGGGNDPVLRFATQTSGTVYWSALVNVAGWSATTAPGSTGKQILSFTNNYTSTSDIRYPAALVVKAISTTAGETSFQFGLANEQVGGANIGTYVTTTYNNTQNFFVVLSFNIDTQVANLWINPVLDPNGTLPAAGPTATFTGTSTSSTTTDIAGFFIRLDSNANTPSTTVDEIRIGTTWQSVTGTTLGINSNALSSVSIYPNPAKGTFNINSNGSIIDSISIHNLDGKMVLKSNNKTNTTMDVSSLAKGIYIVTLQSQNDLTTQKLIIE